MRVDQSDTGPGQCLYRPYLGIAYRDKTYDNYMNSQECLYGPGSEFLSQFTLLLRADLDTFPTPRLLGYWPQGVIVDKNYLTNFDLETIKTAVRSRLVQLEFADCFEELLCQQFYAIKNQLVASKAP